MTVLNQDHCLPSSVQPQVQPPHDQELPVFPSASVSAKGKRKMFEPEISVPLTPPPSQPTPHFQPPSPELPIHLSPRIIRRMQTDICYRCGQQGHWALYCPLNSPNTKSNPRTITDYSDCTKIYCRCGHGFCEVKTAQNERNKGRKYYVCPIKRGKRCKDFVKWCNDPITESDSQPPPYKYPECKCGAGVCRKERQSSGPDAGKYYFACPLPKYLGACSHHMWEDALLETKSIVPVQQQTCQRTLNYYWESCQVGKTNNDDLGKESDPQLKHSKRVRIMDDSQCSPVVALPELPSGEDMELKAAPKERREHGQTTVLSTPSNHVAFPEFDVSDVFMDLDMTDSVSWDALEERARACQVSCTVTPSRICCQQEEFLRQISTFVDASFGAFAMGWLGRLVFFHPTKNIKFPPPQPFFCCVFPSFDTIRLPKQDFISNSPCDVSNQLVISNCSQLVQLSTGCLAEVPRDVVSSNLSPSSGRKPMSKGQRQRQMVLFAQQQLLIDLETLNPLDHESMREAAEATFGVLDSLSLDYKQYAEHVWEFINCASSLAAIENSIKNYPSPEENIQRYEKEKVRLLDIYIKTKASLELSHQRSQSLREEASHLKAMLRDIENQLTSCELETSKMETDLGEINKNMLEVERNLKASAEQAQVARKLEQEKKIKQTDATRALAKIKLELEE